MMHEMKESKEESGKKEKEEIIFDLSDDESEMGNSVVRENRKKQDDIIFDPKKDERLISLREQKNKLLQ